MGIILPQSADIKPPMWAIDPGIVAYNAARMGLPMPVLCLPLWEGGGDKAYDLAGATYNGTITDGAWNNSALIFNGSSTIVNFDDISNLEGMSQISVFVGLRNLFDDPDASDVFTKNLAWALRVVQGSGAPAFFVYDGVGWKFSQGTTDISNNTDWHNLVGTWDGDNVKFYLDGIQEGTPTACTAMGTSANNVLLGELDGAGTYFDGEVRIAIVFPAALTAAQVQTLSADPYGLVRQPDYTDLFAAAQILPGAIMNQFQKGNLGADLFNGTFL